MSDIIHLLPDHIANQIAAGEVIQRPASVVKELMENSVDAGAGSISVNIKDAGRTLIQIVDDGKGMSETDARMAFERHATSKILTVDDLFSLNTMGFRGEALASIAAVAQVELRTRVKNSDVGTFLSISGSTLDSIAPEACNEGSIFSVKNLFYNVPARRKFLKANETEFRHIITEFERVVIVNPHISFTLRHNDSVLFELPACGLRQRIIDIFGKGMNQKLLSVDVDTSIVKVHGFTGRLDAVKKRGSLQYLFVNGRFMRHPYFHKAVLQAYEQMIPVGDMPDYFLYFTLDPSTIDVNIHPTKTEIKFENERAIWQIIFSAVRESLAKSNSVPTINFDQVEKIDIPIFNPRKDGLMNTVPPQPQLLINKDYNPFRDTPVVRPTENWESLYESFEKKKSSPQSPPLEGESELGEGYAALSEDKLFTQTASSDEEPMANLFSDFSNFCFQYKCRYIITPLKSGLVIIDQHRAHVRILFEKFIANIRRQCSASQKLLFPEVVEFTASETLILDSIKDEIKILGFDLAFLGGNSYAINAVPADAMGGSPAALVKDIVAAAIDDGAGNAEIRIEKVALALAKATAIRSGKTLTPEEMETLIASLFAIESHGLTPDGLPVLTILTDDELKKRL